MDCMEGMKQYPDNHFDMSVERFQNCTSIEPDSVGAYQNMVYSLMNAGRYDELETPLLKIIDINNSADAYVDLLFLFIVFHNSRSSFKNKNPQFIDKTNKLWVNLCVDS